MHALPGRVLRLCSHCAWLHLAVGLSLVEFVAGCASLTQSLASVDGANPERLDLVALVAVDTEQPVVVRAVDEKYLSGVQVSSKLRSFTYAVHPGTHVLWVSSAPYGLPLVPQRIKCYTISAKLSAGASYSLRFESTKQTPVLSHSSGFEPEVSGVLVDEPFVHERGCKW